MDYASCSICFNCGRNIMWVDGSIKTTERRWMVVRDGVKRVNIVFMRSSLSLSLWRQVVACRKSLITLHPLRQGVALRLCLSCHLRTFWTQVLESHGKKVEKSWLFAAAIDLWNGKLQSVSHSHLTHLSQISLTCTSCQPVWFILVAVCIKLKLFSKISYLLSCFKIMCGVGVD